MARFAYTYLDHDGKQYRGVIEAETSRNALSVLSKKKQIILSIEPVGVLNGLLAWLQTDIGGKRSVPLNQQVYLARSISTLLGSGMTLEQTLGILAQGHLQKKTKKLVKTLLRGVRNGNSLTQIIDELNVKFDPAFAGMIKTADKSGLLAECLSSAADILIKKSKSRRNLINALIYPAVLLITSLLAFGFLFSVVIPRLRSLFEGSGQQIPPLTKALLLVSETLQYALPVMIPALLGSVIILAFVYSRAQGRYWIQQLLISLPFIGTILRLSEITLLTRSLGISFKVGMVASAALSSAAENLALEPYRRFISSAALDVRQGEQLSSCLAKSQKLFPARVIQIIEIGESSGDLTATMRHVAELLEDELETRRSQIIALTTPAFLLFFGGLTAVVMFAVWSSILNLNNAVLS